MLQPPSFAAQPLQRVSTRAHCLGEALPPPVAAPAAHVRRPRYAGKTPRTFAEKYKERAADETVVAAIEAKGNTASGTHRCAHALQPVAPRG